MMSPEEARAFASEFKQKSQVPNTSKDRAFIMVNIARSFARLATQLDMLASKTREEAGGKTLLHRKQQDEDRASR